MRIRVEQAFHRHDHAGGAETALKSLVFQESLLHIVKVAVLREAFDSGDLFVFDVARECEAGADGLAVDEHGAGAADADATTFNRSFKFKIVAQEFQQRLIGIDLNRLLMAVDRCREQKFHVTVSLWQRSMRQRPYRVSPEDLECERRSAHSLLRCRWRPPLAAARLHPCPWRRKARRDEAFRQARIQTLEDDPASTAAGSRERCR